MADISNFIEVIGDKNIILQNINANNITIISGNEENKEVTSKKKLIAESIAELVKQLDEFKKADKAPEVKVSEDDFDDIDFDDLVNAIKYDNCVVFIGPEISTNGKNESLHQNFYKEISSKNTMYDELEGFFMPQSEKKLKTKMMTFYNEDFHQQNEIAYNLLQKIAQIPFSLIISSAPADTLHRILDVHNKQHSFLFYNETEIESPEPTKEQPVIYNFLGNPADNGKFIFTHQQFHDYINQKQKVKIPTEIEAKVQEAEHFLFIGFDFDKWQNRLALLTFSLETDGYFFSDKKISSEIEQFLKKQFNISQIEQNYNDFIDLLLYKTHEEGLTVSLSQIFFENTLRTLERIRARTLDTNKLEPLLNIEENLNQLKEKFF